MFICVLNLYLQEVFVFLRQVFDVVYVIILEREGGLIIMCVCIVCLVKNFQQFVICCVNVGDSYCYIFSYRFGIRELIIGLYDIILERDIRDVGGVIGLVCGNDSEFQNLICLLFFCELGDIVFLIIDGILDNFDFVVIKFALSKKINDVNSNEFFSSFENLGKFEMEFSERYLYVMK